MNPVTPESSTGSAVLRQPDLSAPLWTIEHLAAVFYLTPDAARE